MSSVVSAIASLLYDHDTVIVPGLGAFIRHDQSAHVNVITNEFQRPSSQLGFNPRQREEHPLLIETLVATDGITNDEAREAIASFVNDCFAQLKVEGTMPLPGIGTLTMDEQQALSFEPDNTNFNSDAFGLEDINPEPVYGTVNLVSNPDPTPLVTHPDPSTPDLNPAPTPSELQSSRWWLWVLLLLLLAAGTALWYFKFRPVTTKPWPSRNLQPRERILPPTVPTKPNDTLTTSVDTLLNPTVTPETTSETTPETTPETTSETASEIIPETTPKSQGPSPVAVAKPEATSKAFIVGGCFSMEKNALNMLVEVQSQGCIEAFVMKRGTRFFVCYGQYPSTADAKAALPDVLANYNAKAWILKK